MFQTRRSFQRASVEAHPVDGNSSAEVLDPQSRDEHPHRSVRGSRKGGVRLQPEGITALCSESNYLLETGLVLRCVG